MADIAELGFKVDSNPLAKANDELEKLPPRADKAEQATERFNREVKKTGAVTKAASGGIGDLSTVVARLAAGVATYFSVQAIIGYADAWSDMQSRVGAAIKDMEAAPALMQRLLDIANASYSPLAQTVEIYGRNVSVLKALGLGAKEAADYTESLNHMLVITATRGERAESVQNALSKAMALGKLNGEGLETVLANGGRVAEALAIELGTTVNGLRAMASEGKITSQVIANALLGSLEDVREEAGAMTATVADAFVIMNNNITAAIGQFDKAYGISAKLAEGIIFLANNLDLVAAGAAGLAAALTVALLPAIAAATTAFLAFTAALLANPLTWVAAAAGALTTAFIALNKNTWEVEGAIKTANAAYASNATAMGTAKAASGGYTAALRNQVAMQVEAAKSALTLAQAEWEASVARRDAMREMLGGWRFAPTELDTDIKFGNVNAMDRAFTQLQIQLETIDANLIETETSITKVGDATGAAATKTVKATELMSEAFQKAKNEWSFYESTFTGFFSGFRSELMAGTSLWDSFRNAASKALDSIANRMLDMATSSIFQMIFGAFMPNSAGAGWGIAGGFGKPGIFGIPGFSSGGYTGNGAVNAAAGVVHGKEFVMNAQATRAIGVGTLQAINDNHVLPANDNGGGFVYQDNRTYDFSGSGLTRQEIEEILANDRAEMIDNLPNLVQGYQNDPRKRTVRNRNAKS